ncbi:MAG: serine/threonine protein kinase [Anaerolineaceae bacterium]|nr:serine/threonine protein kinase [Anaerolineaceae bacterium]
MNHLSEAIGGRYQLNELLGQGGMAYVYKAFDERLERNVALKVIRATHQDSQQFLQRFEREAKALAKLSHTNIVNVHDFGEHNHMPFIVMEYLSGGTLKERIGKPMNYREAAKLLVPIADGLHYAHQHGIIHRDIKPANILFTELGVPRISDFGIAKMISGEDQNLTKVGTGIGTPEYMAPEQGQGLTVDHRADIYALGVVFYELLTGRKPYEAETPTAVFWKQMTEPLPSPKQFVPSLPNEIVLVLTKALAREAGLRYQTMADFRAILQQISLGDFSRITQAQEDATQIMDEAKTSTNFRVEEDSTIPAAGGELPIPDEIPPEFRQYPQSQPTPLPMMHSSNGTPIPPASLPYHQPTGQTPPPEPKKKKGCLIWGIVGGALLLIAICIGGIIALASSDLLATPTMTPTLFIPTDTPVPAPTAVPTDTPEPTAEVPEEFEFPTAEAVDDYIYPTMDPNDPIQSCMMDMGITENYWEGIFEPIFCDTFVDNRNEWYLEPFSNENVSADIYLENQSLNVEVTANSEYAMLTLPIPDGITGTDQVLESGDFIMFYNFIQAYGGSSTFTGVQYFKSSEDQFYLWSFYPEDIYQTFYYYNSGYTFLTDYYGSDYLAQDWNMVEIFGGYHDATLNDNDYWEFEDSTIPQYGLFAFAFGADVIGESALFAIDDLVILRVIDGN